MQNRSEIYKSVRSHAQIVEWEEASGKDEFVSDRDIYL